MCAGDGKARLGEAMRRAGQGGTADQQKAGQARSSAGSHCGATALARGWLEPHAGAVARQQPRRARVWARCLSDGRTPALGPRCSSHRQRLPMTSRLQAHSPARAWRAVEPQGRRLRRPPRPLQRLPQAARRLSVLWVASLLSPQSQEALASGFARCGEPLELTDPCAACVARGSRQRRLHGRAADAPRSIVPQRNNEESFSARSQGSELRLRACKVHRFCEIPSTPCPGRSRRR